MQVKSSYKCPEIRTLQESGKKLALMKFEVGNEKLKDKISFLNRILLYSKIVF